MKHHTQKTQLIANPGAEEIPGADFYFGKKHDFQFF
jgi:hypothetical protein